jgi:hypothetical protein
MMYHVDTFLLGPHLLLSTQILIKNKFIPKKRADTISKRNERETMTIMIIMIQKTKRMKSWILDGDGEDDGLGRKCLERIQKYTKEKRSRRQGLCLIHKRKHWYTFTLQPFYENVQTACVKQK